MPNKRVLFSATSPDHPNFKGDPRGAVEEIVVSRHGGELLALWFDVDGRRGHALVGGDLDEERLAALLKDLDAVDAELVLTPEEWRGRVS